MAKRDDSNVLNTTPIDLDNDLVIEDESTDESVITLNSRRDVRSLIFQILYKLDRFDYTISPEEVVRRFEQGFNLQLTEDFSDSLKMLHGISDQREELYEQIKPLLKNWKLERLGCCTRLILIMALWELRQPNVIPSIAINEAIELAKSFAEKDAHKFINGVLDEYCKKMNLIKKDDKKIESDS